MDMEHTSQKYSQENNMGNHKDLRNAKPISQQVDKAYEDFAADKVDTLPKTGEWPSLIWELAPQNTKDEELPKVAIADLIREACRRLQPDDQPVSLFGKELHIPAYFPAILKGTKPFRSINVKNILDVLGGKGKPPLEQLEALFTKAANLPPCQTPKVVKPSPRNTRKQYELIMSDQQIAGVLGIFSNKRDTEESQEAIAAYRREWLEGNSQWTVDYRRAILARRKRQEIADAEEAALEYTSKSQILGR